MFAFAKRLTRLLTLTLFLLYWLATRLTLFALLTFTSLYFLLNAGPFPSILSDLLRSVLPGTLNFERIQVSPLPGKVDVIGLRITTPKGEDVVTARSVEVSLDLIPLFRFLLGQTETLELTFKSVRLHDFFNEIAFDEKGELKFLEAFVWPKKAPSEKEGKGTNVLLRFRNISGEGGSFHLSFPEWELFLEGIEFNTSLLISVEERTKVEIRTPLVTFSSGEGRVHVAREVQEIPRRIRLLSGQVEGFRFDTDRFFIRSAHIPMEGMEVEATGSLAFPEDGPLAYDARVSLLVPEGSPLLELATHGLVRGKVEMEVQGSGDDHDPRFSLDLRSPSLFVAGYPLGEVHLALEGGRLGNSPYAFHNISVSARPFGGHLRIQNGAFWPFGTKAMEASGEVQASSLDLLPLFQSLSLPKWVPLPRTLSLDLKGKAVFGSKSFQVVATSDFSGLFSQKTLFDSQAFSGHFQARLDSLGEGSKPTLKVTSLTFASGRDICRLRGSFDAETGSLRLFGDVSKDLRPLLLAFGVDGEGNGKLKDLRLSGTFSEPSLSALVEVKGLRVMDWRFDEVKAQVRGGRSWVRLSSLEATSGYAMVEASSVEVGPLSSKGAQKLTIKDATISKINLLWAPYVRPFGVRGSGKVSLQSLAFDLGAPLQTISGSGSLSFPMVSAFGHLFQRIETSFRAFQGNFELGHLSLLMDGKGKLSGTARLDLPRRYGDITLSLQGLPLSALSKTQKIDGIVGVETTIRGSLLDPTIEARAAISDLLLFNSPLGSIEVRASREPGGDMRFSSDKFLPKMELDNTSRILFGPSGPEGIVVHVKVSDLSAKEIFPDLEERDLDAHFTGDLYFRMGFGPSSKMEAILTSPPEGLRVRLLDTISLTNREGLEVFAHEDGDVTLRGLALDDGFGTLRVCGEVVDKDGNVNLLVRGPVSLEYLRYLKTVFSSAKGHIFLAGDGPTSYLPQGCEKDMLEGDGAFVIRGPLTSPSPMGRIRTGDIVLRLRRYAEDLKVEEGGTIHVRGAGDGQIEASIPDESPLRLRVGDGHLIMSGLSLFRGLLPDEGRLRVSGSDLRFTSPGTFFVVLNPDVNVEFFGMAQGEQRMKIAGEVKVTEGSYHRNFDVFRRAFKGLTGVKVAERESAPLEVVAPWLAKASLDLAVTSPRFGVRSKLPFGSTDLDLALDLSVRGTVREPEVWNRAEVLPGGKVVYSVVRREFEVVRGTFDFDGDPTHPLIDVVARTVIRDAPSGQLVSSGGSRFEPDWSTKEGLEGGILVTLGISGRVPDLDISLSSNAKDLDQTDLQYLLLTGSTRRELAEGRTSVFDLGLVTEDVTNLVTNLLLSPFVDAIRFGVSPSGGVSAEVQAHLGSRVRFETQVLQEQTGSRYRAGFHVRLTSRLYLEGKMRAVEQSLDPSEVGRHYEAKLRYRIPLE